MASIDISKTDQGYVRLTKRSGGCDSGVEQASCYWEVAGLISPGLHVEVSLGKIVNPHCSWCAGLHLVWQLPPSVYELL